MKRKLKRLSREHTRKIYRLNAPAFSRKRLGRTKHTFAVLPPHVVMTENLENNLEILDELKDAIDGEEPPVAYYENKIVASTPRQTPQSHC